MAARLGNEVFASGSEGVQEVDADGEILAARRAHEAGDHLAAARALERAARGGAAQRALEVAQEYACDAAGELKTALDYVVATLSFPAGPDDSAEADLEGADELRLSGELDAARVRYEVLTDHPDLGTRLIAFGRLARLRMDAGDRTGVEALLLTRLAMVYSERNNEARALTILSAIAESGEPTALYALGKLLLESDEPEKAREVLMDVAGLDSGFRCRALVHVGETYLAAGDSERARELFLLAADEDGPDAERRTRAKMHLAFDAKEARDFPEARRRYQDVLDSGTAGHAPLASAHLGEIAYWLGEEDEAVRNYVLTLATGTGSAELVGEAAFRVGEIHFARGHAEAAKEYLVRAVDVGFEPFAAKAAGLLAELQV